MKCSLDSFFVLMKCIQFYQHGKKIDFYFFIDILNTCTMFIEPALIINLTHNVLFKIKLLFILSNIFF